ncbi:MAG: type II toxin-antitoxin system VapC family toxin [Rhodothermales bacterium]|nr:type II toxin-antitoxin system VapC family toxin [Rhodothermales bacterium]MBO6780077.1 type II toxin-antitoxin system VapC family toxin [Rhodothermales bacterium]
MIVADTNLVVHFFVRSGRTEGADGVFSRDPVWCAPSIWKSEFRNTLLQLIKHRRLSVPEAAAAWANATLFVRTAEMDPPVEQVLDVGLRRGLSAYDAEFVVTAQRLGLQLITTDRGILSTCRETAISPEDFCRRS